MRFTPATLCSVTPSGGVGSRFQRSSLRLPAIVLVFWAHSALPLLTVDTDATLVYDCTFTLSGALPHCARFRIPRRL